MMKDRYWLFGGTNIQAVYGWGSAEEASKYQDYLNRDREINHYEVLPVSEENAERMRLGDEAFVIEAEIAELKAQGDWED